MCPQECFAYYKRLFWPFLCHKRIGLPYCILFAVTVTCLLQIILVSNYSLLLISVLAEKTLLKTSYRFLMLLVGFDSLTYQKDYDRSPTLVGHQDSFLGRFWECSAFGRWNLVRKNLYSVLKFTVTCYYGEQSFEGFVRGIFTLTGTTIICPSTYCTY